MGGSGNKISHRGAAVARLAALELSIKKKKHDGAGLAATLLLPPRTNPQVPQAHATLGAVAAKLNATATAVAAAVDLSKLSGAVVVDPAAPKFTGSITCYVDDATGLVAGLQLGAAPVLCSSAGAKRAFAVPADGYVSNVKVAVDPKTGLVGQMLFTVKSNSSLLPTNVVTCGTVAGAPVSILPKLSALSTLSATCAPAPAGPAGRRLAQAAPFIAPGSLRATVTTLAAAGGSAVPPPPPSVSYAYVTDNGGSGTVSACTGVGTGTLTCTQAASGLASPTGIAVSGSYAYVADFGGGTVSACTGAGTGTLTCAVAASGLGNLVGIAVSGSYAYVADGGTVSACTGAGTGTLTCAVAASGFPSVQGIAVS